MELSLTWRMIMRQKTAEGKINLQLKISTMEETDFSLIKSLMM
jgi:hypothetical protein